MESILSEARANFSKITTSHTLQLQQTIKDHVLVTFKSKDAKHDITQSCKVSRYLININFGMKNPFFTIFGNYDVINELCRQNEVTKQTSLNSNDYKTH